MLIERDGIFIYTHIVFWCTK